MSCSSKGETSETSSVGKVPEQVGPAPKAPVQTSVPLSGRVVLPEPAPPVTMVPPAICEAGRGAE